MAKTIEEAGGRLLVLKMAGEGASLSQIRDKLREEGICSVSIQTVSNYLHDLSADPAMRKAMEMAARRYIEQGADTLVITVSEQLKRFRRLVSTVMEGLEPVLTEFDENLRTALPMREDEDPIAYKARMETIKAAFENLPKLDARLEAWSKFLGNLQGVEALRRDTTMLNSPVAPNVTVNVQNITMQYQRIMVDFLGWLPPDKQSLFREKLAQLQPEA